ncbi:MAG: hypothetical protein SO415_07745 [Oliverpabstia sp.]|nr:hypothetical protein [Oliverpabstia sp.]
MGKLKKIARIIGEKAIKEARESVGRSTPMCMHEIDVPEELRKKVKDESDQ